MTTVTPDEQKEMLLKTVMGIYTDSEITLLGWEINAGSRTEPDLEHPYFGPPKRVDSGERTLLITYFQPPKRTPAVDKPKYRKKDYKQALENIRAAIDEPGPTAVEVCNAVVEELKAVGFASD